MNKLEQPLHVHTWGQGERIVLIHGSNVDNPEILWLSQQDLASRYQLLLLHRRGYGLSPQSLDTQGFEQNIDDITSLLGEGAHVVGHSYGGVLAIVAATRTPQLIKSLTVIEPPAFGLTINQPHVLQVVSKLQHVYQSATTPEDFLIGFLRAMGNNFSGPLTLSSQHRKGILTTMTEIAPWNIILHPQALVDYHFPKLVVSGNWHHALASTADLLTELLQAEHLVVPNVGHDIQKIGLPFNNRLEALIALSHTTNNI